MGALLLFALLVSQTPDESERIRAMGRTLPGSWSPDGWRKTRWGMGALDVLEAVSSQSKFKVLDAAPDRTCILLSDPTERAPRVCFEFDALRLVSVSATLSMSKSLEAESGDRCELSNKVALAALERAYERYGKPSCRDAEAGSFCVWPGDEHTTYFATFPSRRLDTRDCGIILDFHSKTWLSEKMLRRRDAATDRQ